MKCVHANASRVSGGGSERSLPWDTPHCTLWVHVCRHYSGVPERGLRTEPELLIA